MIAIGDLASIIGIALGWALAVSVVGLLLLLALRRRSLLLQVGVIVLTVVASTVAGVIAVANAMYLSAHDLTVVFYVAGVAALISLVLAILLGSWLTSSARRLVALAGALSEGGTVDAADARGWASEFAAVADQLADTSRRLAESRAEVAAIDESRRELIAWISHDLRTPLAGLRAMAEALEDGLAADPLRFHRQMRSQVDHLSTMVDDLFELSKIQSGTLRLVLEPVRVYDLVSDAVAELTPLASARSVTLVERPGPDVLVLADDRGLSRVIGNLLVNAIQHAPEGSSVTIGTAADGARHVVLSVADRGGGIPEEDLARVFEAGWRASASRTPESLWGVSAGAGLGLAIAQGIVQAHRGEISVRNEDDGCRFEVSLPTHLSVEG
ncbi:sensor histidine kinase [Humibacter ginsenosidimutans]|uniref:histidine kinase n=1 Tax=Humibacter ginsenosidimutans TaxID=2599293 RepID=A0A5B8M5S5_9MICO|nr:HAMP domain-containing sensor histidine kinase [Humibacter ginsenosidimutans]QDZ16138.1 HAMP domain-containing histidine kinase [Humibacter ginsenosidimutans]